MSTNAKVSRDQRYTPNRRCPICDGHEDLPRGEGKRCTGYFAGSGKSAFCERVESAESIESAVGTLFKHRLRGDCPCGHQHAPPDPVDRRETKPRKGYRTPQEAARRLGRGLGRIAGHWPYHDAQGRPCMAVYRFESADGAKTYRPVHRNGSELWHVGDPEGPLPLYHLPELPGADLVVITEGEKAADAARSLGLVATTPAHGAESPKRSDWSPLAGKAVVILPDNDEPGRKFALAVADLLARLDPAPTVKVLDLPGLPERGDVVEWCAAGGTRAELLDLIERARPLEGPKPSANGDGKAPTATATAGGDDELGPFPLTDLGNAERFARDHADIARYVGPWKKWLVFVHGQWVIDETGAVVRLGKTTVRGIAAEAAGIADPDQFKAMLGWARKSEGARQISDMIRLAGSERGIAISHRQLNADPWALNVRNGTIDLRTGELRPHDRLDLITHQAPVDYDPDAECPLWLSELDTVFAKDAALIAFFQRLCGYWLTGVVRDQVLPIAYGKGRNGKSTVIGTLLRILGNDYAYEADPGLIMQRSSEDHPTEKAALFGKRMVSLSETDSGKRLNEALVKRLTGKEQITARRMREDPWSFWPTHKLILSTNHRPEIRGTDTAIWRRVLLVPFTATIDPKDEITDFADRLAAEDAGILAWIVRGCLAWQQIGLNPPESVVAATRDYRDSQDTIASFIAERCLASPSVKERSGEFYRAYCDWAKENGEETLGSRTFYEAMADRGYPSKVGTSNRRFMQGIALRKNEG